MHFPDDARWRPPCFQHPKALTKILFVVWRGGLWYEKSISHTEALKRMEGVSLF